MCDSIYEIRWYRGEFALYRCKGRFLYRRRAKVGFVRNFGGVQSAKLLMSEGQRVEVGLLTLFNKMRESKERKK